MMRTLFYLITSLILPAMVSAQTIDEFKNTLAQPIIVADSYSESKVVVREYGNVSEVVTRAVQTSKKSNVNGYRVCIFFDNGEDARTGAVGAKALFERLFYDEKVYIAYENPYFMVTVGDCLTSEEGIILLERVRNTFPKAYIKSENISFIELLKRPIVRVVSPQEQPLAKVEEQE